MHIVRLVRSLVKTMGPTASERVGDSLSGSSSLLTAAGYSDRSATTGSTRIARRAGT